MMAGHEYGLGSCVFSLFHLQHGVTAVGCVKFRDSIVDSVGQYCSLDLCVFPCLVTV